MKRTCRTVFVAVATFISTSTFAAPAEQADCPYDALAQQERELVGRTMFAQMGGDKDLAPEPSSIAEAQTAMEAAMDQCVTANEWTENEASSAFSYASTRMLADVAKGYVQRFGGDAAVADLFFAQNKYQILEEGAAGNDSRDWANTRLVEMGFAKAKSPAFDAVWLYLGLLFQIDEQREAFITGQKPEWSK